ncbi:hypothetical protein CesoFtcFv8_024126 [Champsocephalus esox]|uniref:Secreted protein n=1 Tax=Champsocephalus esox TaxID=159716 RepID=A0AAN8B6C8_9TELE|nr:hypothetical protein CesoFtcFv8_024126 [Champsocephalus esox]
MEPITQVSVFLFALRCCHCCDQPCFQESMRFICSSFALSLSVIGAPLLNTRGAWDCSRMLNHLPRPANQL